MFWLKNFREAQALLGGEKGGIEESNISNEEEKKNSERKSKP